MDESNRFRRALKNPILVGGLCLLAVMALYFNFTDSSGKGNSPLSIPKILSRNQTDPDTTPTVQAAKPDISKIAWIEHPLRDPFSPFRSMEQEGSRVSRDGQFESPGKSAAAFQPLVLKAVAVEDEVKTAVINRTIVHEGELVEGFLVLSIGPTGVWLERSGTKSWLTFQEKKIS